MTNPILTQLQRRKKNEDKLREVQKFYTNAAREREFLNPRNRFDRSEFREVLVDQGGTCNGFIEGLIIANKKESILNIGFKPKYKIYQNLLPMINMILDDDIFKNVDHFYSFIHIGDSHLEHALDLIGFRRVVDKPTLSRLQSKLDGYHLVYLFERKHTVANRPEILTRRNSQMLQPRSRPLRTGNEQTEGKFDSLLRLKQLKEKK